MSCQSAPDRAPSRLTVCGLTSQPDDFLCILLYSVYVNVSTIRFLGAFFECGQGHRGPMIPYCPGAP
ncbi:unnamed protein product, partial [Staurois parvus]